jgi:uncharacterized membrane protein YfcA
MTWLLGLAIGLLMGITGAGGGVLAVPALVFGLGLAMQQAAPIAMVAVSIAAWVGALEGLRRRVVRWRAAIVIALAASPFAALGVVVAHRLPDLALRVVFIGLLLLVAWRQVASGRRHADPAPAATRSHVAELDPDTGRFVWTRRAWTGFFSIGGAMGFLSGLLGVSGGFVLMPLLSRWTPLPTLMLVGTSLLVSALVTAFGATIAVLHGAALPWPATAWFAAALTAGMALGRGVVHRLPERWIKRAFLALVLTVALAFAVDVAWRLLAAA